MREFTAADWPGCSTPSLRLFLGCCARAATGHTAAAPPSSVMNSRLFTRAGAAALRDKGLGETGLLIVVLALVKLLSPPGDLSGQLICGPIEACLSWVLGQM